MAILALADAEATAQAIRDAGGEAIAVDVSDPEAVERAVGRVESQWGRLDVVFANAGVNGSGPRSTRSSPTSGARPSP